MRNVRLLTVALLVLAVAGFVVAADKAAAKEVTLTGQYACAHCTLHEKDAKGCQDVLVTEDGGQKATYYVVKNETADKFGHGCSGDKKVTITGTVEQKDGKQWITANRIEEAKG